MMARELRLEIVCARRVNKYAKDRSGWSGGRAGLCTAGGAFHPWHDRVSLCAFGNSGTFFELWPSWLVVSVDFVTRRGVVLLMCFPVDGSSEIAGRRRPCCVCMGGSLLLFLYGHCFVSFPCCFLVVYLSLLCPPPCAPCFASDSTSWFCFPLLGCSFACCLAFLVWRLWTILSICILL